MTGLVEAFSHLHYLEKVLLKRCAQISNKAIMVLAAHSVNLQVLNVCGCLQISDESLTELARRCSRLKVLTLDKTCVS